MKINITKDLKYIYSRLQDDESKMIFRHRLNYFLDGDRRHIDKMLRELKPRDEYYNGSRVKTLADIQQDGEQFRAVLYGAGNHASLISPALEMYNVSPICFCDSDPAKNGGRINGYDIISPETLIQDYRDSNIIITSPKYRYEIYSFFLDVGVPKSRLFFLPSLSDETYFGNEFMIPSENEVYVDAGAFDGDSISAFLSFCNGKYKKIYALEPDPKNYSRLIRNIEKNQIQNVFPVQKGSWSSSTTLHFRDEAGEKSRIIDGGVTKIETITIDELTDKDDVAFIKMDVEGAELESLKGAAETIKRNKPKLAICIYHKPEDILEIPLYLSKIVPEYKFYIRHHQMSYFETVLYAVC